MKILLFTSSNCPYCPQAKRVLESVLPDYSEYDIDYNKIRLGTNDGKEIAIKYNITSTPTIIIANNNSDEIKRIVGVPDNDKLKNEIEKAIGLKKSFFSKIFGK